MSVCKFSHKYLAMIMNICKHTIETTDNLHTQNRYSRDVLDRILKYIEQSHTHDEVRQKLNDLKTPMLFKDK
jgi:hypothetical protein